MRGVTRNRLCILLLAVVGLTLSAQPARPEPPASPATAAFFESRIRPVLAENCFKCHGSAKQRGGLRLDSRKAILAGGEQGPSIVPGEPDRSLLVKAVRQTDDEIKMPPTAKLSNRQIDDLAQWVRMGAPWTGGDVVAAPVKPAPDFQVADKDRAHWAFRRVKRPPIAAVRDRGHVQNPIDSFVLARLEPRGLQLSPPAARRDLARRVYFDLLGLPPAPEEIDTFVSDDRPDAYERLIDRLLASPHYGERWARHWLDVVRFGQTHGYERDDEKPNAWRYRDYVIKVLNEDRPYDQFVREQIAGDELTPVTDEGLIATAFFRLGVWDDEPDDARQAEFDNLDDMLSTTGEAFLGLSIGCARCHDHKFDPLGQEDYYSLLAFYRNIIDAKQGDFKNIQVRLKAGGQTLAVRESGPKAPPTAVLLRGSAATPGKPVEPRFPLVLCPTKEAATAHVPSPPTGAKCSGRRRVLADWIASPDNPLTARVIVNRLWQHDFGRGLVATPNDFGRNGSAPTHPELLDWLAAELVESGWRLKHIHKMILMSATYQQASRADKEAVVATDPDNRLLWRQNLRRLEAEAVRDAVLAVSGRLNPAMGGRGIFPTLPPEVLSTQSKPGLGWDKSSPEEQARRSVYIFVKRTLGVPLLETFDFASPDKSTAARSTTTIAPQALILLNSSFMEEQSAAFAERLLREAGPDSAANVERVFRLALGRGPSPRERQIAWEYLGRAQPTQGSQGYRLALARLCKLVFNLNEFVYVD
jgi:mono/diheme cytochrome c family protein